MSKVKAEDVDEYIARSALEARPNLIELRELIVSTVPEVEERISYGVPFYRYHGDLAGFAAYKNHVSFGFGADVLPSEDRKMLEEAGYTLGKVTMQIAFDHEVPTTVIQGLLRARARMNEAKERQ